MIDIVLSEEIENVKVLGIFKTFCKTHEKQDDIKRIRNILSLSKNKEKTVVELIKREQNVELNKSESLRMLELIKAFINKSSYRKPIEPLLKEKLLKQQECKCAICKTNIDINAHSDHIVPFKYVGDCLENNWQLLCQRCNEAKNDSLDYQIRYILKLL